MKRAYVTIAICLVPLPGGCASYAGNSEDERAAAYSQVQGGSSGSTEFQGERTSVSGGTSGVGRKPPGAGGSPQTDGGSGVATSSNGGKGESREAADAAVSSDASSWPETSIATGGAPSTGGSTSDGGSASTGGSTPDGGVSAGGSTPDGGVSAGGSTSDGGSTPDGGISAGGSTSDGGATSTGGGPSVDAGTGASQPDDVNACLRGITRFDTEGPFTYVNTVSDPINFWVPNVPAGCRVPVLHLSNGTGASCAIYEQILERFASHGFLSACYESTQTGDGTQAIDALSAAFQSYPDLVDNKIASVGHSQGGQGALVGLRRAEARWGDTYSYAGLAMQPASGYGTQPTEDTWQKFYAAIQSPSLLFSGTEDTLVSQSWAQQGFDALSASIEAYHWSAIGATHIPVPTQHTMEVGVSWFRWKLLDDAAACQAFKALPAGTNWSVVDDKNAAVCP